MDGEGQIANFSQDQQVNQRDLEIKRQYIQELRQRLQGAQQEFHFLRQEADQQMQQMMNQQ